MRIQYSVEWANIDQDGMSSVKDEICRCPFSLDDLVSLPSLLHNWNCARRFRDECDSFNLRLWIGVFNKLDEALELIVNTLCITIDLDHLTLVTTQEGSADQAKQLTVAAERILQWSTYFLQCSFNKYVYKSADVSIHHI